MKVTAQMLRDKEACEDQVEVFEREWPDGTRITKKACLRAVELDLDVFWCATKFLTRNQLGAYERAGATAEGAYRKAGATAWEAYREAVALALWKASKVK